VAQLFSYWDGPVSWFEQLSAASAIAAGNTLTIFSYGEPSPKYREAGATLVDARELCELRSDYDREAERKIPTHYSDQLRFEGLSKSLGTWADLDCIHVAPIPPMDYLLTTETADPASYLATAVIMLPAQDHTLNDLLRFHRRRPFMPVPPHWTPARRFGKWFEWQTDWMWRPSKLHKVLGPDVLTGFARANGLAISVDCSLYFPLRHERCYEILVPDIVAPELRNPGLILAHIWGKHHVTTGPLPGSFVAEVAERIGFPVLKPGPEMDKARERLRSLSAERRAA